MILKEIIDLRSQGILGGRSFAANLPENGGEDIAFNPEIDIPDDVLAAAEATIEEFKMGGVTEQPDIEPLSIAIVSQSDQRLRFHSKHL